MHLDGIRPRNGLDWNLSNGQPPGEDVNIAQRVEENARRIPFRWHRMVVFSDTNDATTRAIISLYRIAIKAAGMPSGAHLYARRVGRCHFLYFSPEAAQLCAPIFEAFPAVPIDSPSDLHGCTLVNT